MAEAQHNKTAASGLSFSFRRTCARSKQCQNRFKLSIRPLSCVVVTENRSIWKEISPFGKSNNSLFEIRRMLMRLKNWYWEQKEEEEKGEACSTSIQLWWHRSGSRMINSSTLTSVFFNITDGKGRKTNILMMVLMIIQFNVSNSQSIQLYCPVKKMPKECVMEPRTLTHLQQILCKLTRPYNLLPTIG